MVLFLFLVVLFAYILDISAWWFFVQVIIGWVVHDYPYVGGGIFEVLCVCAGCGVFWWLWMARTGWVVGVSL